MGIRILEFKSMQSPAPEFMSTHRDREWNTLSLEFTSLLLMNRKLTAGIQFNLALISGWIDDALRFIRRNPKHY